MPFNLLGYTIEGDKVYFSVDCKSETPLSFKVYSANGNSSKDNIVSALWETTYLDPITVSDVYSAYALEIQSNSNVGGTQFKNIRVFRADRGGLDETHLVNVNGTLLEGYLYGDADADGRVDLADLVRMKKRWQ